MDDKVMWACLNDPASAVEALTWPHDSYMYLERIPETWLTPGEIAHGFRLEHLDLDEDWHSWERARLFCETFELCWERIEAGYQTIYIGPEAALQDFTLIADLDLEDMEIVEESYLMWGNRVPQKKVSDIGVEPKAGQHAFVEFAVPRVLTYPVSEQAENVRLRVRRYVEPLTGIMRAYRFCNLEEVA